MYAIQGSSRRIGIFLRWLVAPVILALSAMLGTSVAVHAELSVCNQTYDVVNLAVGYQRGADFQTSGWWTIGVNQCANVIREDLPSRYVFVYAEDVFGQSLFQGGRSLCIGTKRFQTSAIDQCWQRGLMGVDFTEIDTQQSPRWTLFLRQGGIEGSAD
ncbi:DUF1036 domain-containing protein [Devosia sp. UYZn731]|uniref:DUF1036 domain-containing protein n=1 Tax=Devosia sp. UYZn731 TaxID=3156345 RepID=UPI003394D05E